METLPEALYRPDQVRELDRRTIEDHGVEGMTLMERAGRAAYRLLRRRWPDARRVLVVCGGGNNAGDGYVIARLAARDGLDVAIATLVDPQRLRGDARTAALGCEGSIRLRPFDRQDLDGADVIVDAMLGTGLDRPVEGRFAEAIQAVNASGAGVLAVDVPSGISALTGRCLGIAVRAALTPTFIGLKQGLFTADAPAYTGEVVYDDLGAPAAVFAGMEASALRVRADWVAAQLPRRGRIDHKGRFGHVLVVGGDKGMGGAVRLAAEAAGRLGSGLVSAATRPEHVTPLLAARPEVMCRGVDGPDDLDVLLRRATVVVVGPGLGGDAWGRALLARCLQFEGPMVLDADALNGLAATPQRRDDWVLTPHPGEAGRLLGRETVTVQNDRFAAVESLVERYGGVAVLKGAGTLIGSATGATRLCDAGNPGMATGGMGDVLSGVIGALLAQHLTPIDAAATGVWLHAKAADRAAAGGERGLLATDLLPELRRLANP